MRAIRLAAVAALFAAPALADRPPEPEERAAIEARLVDLGYIDWGLIELEERKGKDLYWEVEDARDAAGAFWYLRLTVKELGQLLSERR